MEILGTILAISELIAFGVFIAMLEVRDKKWAEQDDEIEMDHKDD